MKGKILFAEYNAETGVSIVCKQTKYGTYTKSVKVADEDQDIANQYSGCRFAEMKCDIAAYKRRAQNMEERVKGAQHLVNIFNNMNYDIYYNDEAESDILNDLIYILQKDADTARETYEILRDSYYAFVENEIRERRRIREKIAKRCEEN